MSDPIGEVLGGRFAIQGVLGRGGLATVYLAYDRLLDARVALKLLHPHLADDPRVNAQLVREVQAASLLRHEAALTARDLHELDGRVGLSMPFHPGRSLAEVVSARGPLPPETVREIGARVAGALAEAHRQGLVHRDLSPANILADEDGRKAVLTDFGLSRLASSASARSTTTLGTPGYAAPEILEGQAADSASDVYGLGAVLYLAATGKAPFEARSAAATLTRQLQGEVSPIRTLRPEFPADLAAKIEAMLARDPLARPASSERLARDLGDASAPAPQPAPLPTPATASAPPTRPRSLLALSKLPPGNFRVRVHVRGGWRRRARIANRLGPAVARVVARAAGLPDEAVLPTPALSAGRLTLVDGVDQATAAQISLAVGELGLRTRVERIGQRAGPLSRILRAWPVAIVAIWMAYAFMRELAPVSLWAAIAMTVIVAQLGRRFSTDLTPSEVAYRPALPEPVPVPEPVAPPTAPKAATDRVSVLRQRVGDELKLLAQAIDANVPRMPEAALRDLRATLSSLSERAQSLGQAAAETRDDISRGNAAGDANWTRERLIRLETLSAAGENVSVAEMDTLRGALSRQQSEDEALDRAETRLHALCAHLGEIGAAAAAARRELADPAADAGSVPRLAEELRQQVRAAAAATREVDRG